MAKIIDEVIISVKAGNGGKGCDSRTHVSEKKFIPTGGEGGRGGNLILRADSNVASLKSFLYQRCFEAESGGPGGSNHKRGRKGKDLVISVPCGTSIFLKEKNFLIRDLVRSGEEVVFLEGGQGGVGNEGRKAAQPGAVGQSVEVTLSLKIPADIFLVGLPNSGKSRLLSRLTHSKAKGESYPFSTKDPELGIYETPEFEQVRLCELPGIYRESMEGRGVGVGFLKHLERAGILLLMLDPLSAFASSLQEGHQILLEVLKTFQPSLLEIPRAVAVNKMDVKDARERMEKEKFRPAEPIFLISAETGEGVEALMRYLTQALQRKSHA